MAEHYVAKKSSKGRMAVEDEETLAKKQEEHKLQKDQEFADLRKILQLPEGKRFFGRVFELGRIFHTTFVSENERQTAFNEGSRSFALKLFKDAVQANPAAVKDLMIRINNKFK